MSISPFGIVLLIYIFALFLLNNDLKAIYIKIFNLFLITALCIRMGYFFRVGSRFYSYSNILLYVVLLISIVLLKGKRLSVKEMCAFFAMLAVFAVNFVSEICIPFKEPIVTNWTKYVCTLTNYVRFSNFYTYVSAN
ncbi:MAG TPA: hypothetical protein DF613_04165, partial [Lachnospiraceae bacterium]|nr:hypothetical protein [Lachnospiraceae bacterium]